MEVERTDEQVSTSEWQIDQKQNSNHDPLLSCLHIVTKLHQNPYSEQALKANVPTGEENVFTPDLFVRAADQAGLAAKIVKRPLKKINQFVLPAVLLLKDKQACVLTEINEEGQAKVIFPDTENAETVIALSELEKTASDYVIFLKPKYRFSDRTEEMLNYSPKNWFWPVLKESKSTYGEAALASILINCFALAVPLFIMNVYDRVVPNHAIETLWVLAIGVIIVFSFDFVLKTLRAYFIDVAGKSVDLKLSSRVFNQILGIKMEARPRSVGAFVNTVHAFETFRDFITSSTLVILIDMPFALLYISVIALVSGSLAYIPLVMMPIVIIAGILLQLPLTELTKESFQHAAEKQATLIESLGGIETLKTASAESTTLRRWEQLLKLSSKLGIKLRMVSNSAINFTVLTQQLATVLVVIFGVYKISEGEITVGALIASTILTGRALAPMAQVASVMTRYFQSKNALESVNKVMKMPLERPPGKKHLSRPKLLGDIEFKNVSFAYPETEIANLKNINFKIKQGEHVGIIGRIGSGKTTIAKMLVGLYQPSSGSILLDHTDIQQLDPAEIRNNIGYVPQDITLFYGSIKDNICLGIPAVDDQDILQASIIAGVDQFVRQHPEGYDRQVGERGHNLSGGQRQSIAIARALLLNPNLLVLDEPTNSIDDSTEKFLRQSLQKNLVNKTLVLVTHKGTMLSLVDRLIVIDQGKIVADGKKEAIVQALREGKIVIK